MPNIYSTLRRSAYGLSVYGCIAIGSMLASVPSMTAQSYCIPIMDCASWGSQITNFQLNTISNPSACGSGGYQDFTAISTNLTPGTSYNFTIQHAETGHDYAIWVDLNNDGDFDGPGEFLTTGSASGQTSTGSISIPPGTPSGTYRLRVRSEFIGTIGASDACATSTGSGEGETEDYSIVVPSTNPCTSPPVAGTLAANPASPCAGTTFSVQSSGGSAGTGLTHQWQSSNDNVTWNDIVGANSPSLTNQVMSGTIYYRLIATCSGQNDTAASITVNPSPFFNCYCTSNANNTADGYISAVNFAGMNNVSPTSCQTYTNYTSVPAPIAFLGATEAIQVTVANCSGGTWGNQAKVFIDWNQNGSYTDPGEEFLLTPPAGTGVGVYSGTINIPANASIGTTGMRVVVVETGNPVNVNACGTYGWGETEDYLVQVFPLPNEDAGIAGLISPAQPACTVSDSIEVSVVNGGQVALTSVTVSYQVNGGTISSANWTGNLAPGASGPFFVGTTPLNDGDVLKVWTSNPNGVADVLPVNDTLEVTLYDALNGAYTVYGTAPDFATVAAGLAAVQQRGTCGNVTFNVRTGTYNERIRLQPFSGAGPNNRITIQSEVLVADSVHFTYNVFNTADNYGVWFDGADYYRINALTIRTTNQAFSNNIRINGGSEYNIVENSRLIGDTTGTADNADRWNIRSADGLDNHNTFRNNLIRGGTRAVSFGGPSISQREVGNRFENNRIENFWLLGLGLFSQDDLTVHGNVARSNRPAANIFKFYVRDVYSAGSFTNNSTDDNRPGVGVVFFNVNGQGGNPFLVANNSFSMADSNTNNTFNDGILLTGGSNMDIVHNSIVTYGDDAGTAPIRIGEDAASNLLALGINVWNNALVNYGNGPAFIANGMANIGSFIHNGLHTDGQNLLRVGTTNYTLASFQSASSHGAGCVVTNPGFTSADLHTCHVDYDNAGTPYPGVTADMDGDLRSASTPDIGADEFIGAGGFTLGADRTVCANTPVVLNENGPFIQGAQYFWSDFSNDSTITVTQPGTYSLLMFSGCAQVQDTVTISHYPAPNASFTSVISFMTGMFSATGTGTGALTYDWDFGDGNTGTGENVNHVYAADGSYTVTLTVSDSCANTTVLTETISITALALDNEGVASVQVWPNPAMETVFLTIPIDISTARVAIRDMAGRHLYSLDLNGYSAGETIQLPVSHIAKGVYLIQVDAQELQWVHKLVKE